MFLCFGLCVDVFLVIYFCGGMDKCSNIVLVFWGSILKVYKEFEGILWNWVFRFLSLFIVGKEESEIREKVKWLIFFIG